MSYEYNDSYDLEELIDTLNNKISKISDLEAKLAESKNKHLLDETEWQDYCAFKHIEPQIKGCLDRERQYEKQLAETEAQNKRVLEKLDLIVRSNQELERKLADYEHDLDEAFKLDDIYAEKLRERHEDYEKMKISFALEQLDKVKELLFEKAIQITGTSVDAVRLYSINEIFNNQIKQLKEMD